MGINELKSAVLNNDLFYSEILFFSTEKKEKVGYIIVFNLRRNLLHDKKYENCNLDSLLSEALNGNYSFSCSELDGCFEPSLSTEKSYKELSFESFLEKYAQYFDTYNFFMIRNDLTEDERLTVAYFLYLNGYYTTYDDYENCYFSKKGFQLIKDDDMEKVDLIKIEE